MVPNRPFHKPDVSRRQLLVTTGSFIIGGGVVAAAGSQPASGAVSTTDLNIPPAEYSGTDGTVADLLLEVVGNYEFRVPKGDTLALSLEVAPEDTSRPDYQAIDTTEESIATQSGAGSYTLSGSLLEHSALEAPMFSAEPEETVHHELPIRVVMDIRSGGESVVTAMSQTVAVVDVTNTSIEASATVVGEGEIAIEV